MARFGGSLRLWPVSKSYEINASACLPVQPARARRGNRAERLVPPCNQGREVHDVKVGCYGSAMQDLNGLLRGCFRS